MNSSDLFRIKDELDASILKCIDTGLIEVNQTDLSGPYDDRYMIYKIHMK